MSDSTPSDSYTQIVQKLAGVYEDSCTSSLLLFKDQHRAWGARFYAPYILKEFSDDHNKIDAGLTGLLFYHDTRDMQREKKYKVFMNTTTVDKDKAIVVQFYDVEAPTQYFAQFVARYRLITVKRDEKVPNFSGKGNWNHFDCALVAAHVKKRSTERKIIITLESVKKQVTVLIPKTVSDKDARFALDHWDHIIYDRNSITKNGTKSYVDYNDNRIVLYQELRENQSADAVVLPTEGGGYGKIAFKSYYSSDLFAEWKDFDLKKLSVAERKEYIQAFGYVDDDEADKPSNEELPLSEN